MSLRVSLGLSFFLAFFLMGCQANHTGFSDASSSASSQGGDADGLVPGTGDGRNHLGEGAVSSCSLQSLTVPVKILFVVDTSGSNVVMTKNRGVNICNPTIETCAAPTDPFKYFRSKSIGNFFDLYKTKSNFSWNLTTFSKGASVSYMISGGRPVFSGAPAMQGAISSFSSATDDGDTPYLAGLANAYSAIAGDPDRTASGAAAPLYYVIFLSDGYPTDALNMDNTVDMSRLNSQIASLLALSPGQIRLSTVYYSSNFDSIAASTMSAMAASGSGQFINANTSTTGSININDLIVIAQRNCH